MADESWSPNIRIPFSGFDFSNISPLYDHQSVDDEQASASRPHAASMRPMKIDQRRRRFNGPATYTPVATNGPARSHSQFDGNRPPAPTNATLQESETYIDTSFNLQQPYPTSPIPSNPSFPGDTTAALYPNEQYPADFPPSPNSFFPDCSPSPVGPISTSATLDGLVSNFLGFGPDPDPEDGLIMSPTTPLQNLGLGLSYSSSAAISQRPLTNSSSFIDNLDDLNLFHGGGFGPVVGSSSGQDGGQDGVARPPGSRGRRPSHSATSATTSSQPQRDCLCPYQGCKTNRVHMSHIINHLIQKHGFVREYLPSVQEASNKHKKECIVVHRESGSGFCNRCWDIFPDRARVDNHKNQESLCENHQHWNKERKREILRDMARKSLSPPDVGSEASRSIVDSGPSTEFDFMGDHLDSDDERSVAPTPGYNPAPPQDSWLDSKWFESFLSESTPLNNNGTPGIPQPEVPGITLNGVSLLEWDNQ